MSQDSDILLQGINLTVGYPNRDPLFADLNIALNAKELVCFMGPNGAGKSTLLRTLACLQQPLKGSVKLPSSAASSSISIVLTERISNVGLTVRELVTFGRYPFLDWRIQLSKMDHDRIDQSIAQVNIRHLADKKIFELSDGQLQMAMIARALAQDTPVILLDEPTAHLDLNNRVEVMKLLRQLARDTNRAVLVATHELDLALQLADVIWITGKQKNIVTGIPEDLVLNGTFDDAFQFKGFDLKSGKVEHARYQGKKIKLNGSGAEYLWSRNALERNGYQVVDDQADCHLAVISAQQWEVSGSEKIQTFNTLHDVLQFLNSI